MKKLLSCLLILPLLVLLGFRAKDALQYKWNCEERLDRAANANTVELAAEELRAALAYIEREGWTSGYTAIFVDTPSNDVGFWYKNIQTSLKELEDLPPETTPLEKSNMLLKLRETLLDREGKVTAPAGISAHPDNKLYIFGYGVLGALAAFGAFSLYGGGSLKRGFRRTTWIEISLVVTLITILAVAALSAR